MDPTDQLSRSELMAAWEAAKRRLDRMTRAERVETLVAAGILTPKGRLRAPYRGEGGGRKGRVRKTG